MPLVISDELLQHANLTELEARVEIACRLYDALKISKGRASHFAGLTRPQFEDELLRRGLPVIRYTREMWEHDLRTLGASEEQPTAGDQSDAGRQ